MADEVRVTLNGVPLNALVTTSAGGATGGDASAANQTATQSTPGADATKATAVQGVTGGKPVSVTMPLSATANKTSVTAATANTTLLAANAARFGATIYYDGAAILYLLEGAGTASATNFTTKLGSGYYTQYDAPIGFVGLIQGIWSSAAGSANVTERVA